MQQKLRVFIVDDHAMVRVGVRMLLEAFEDIRVVGEAAGAAGLAERVVGSEADVLLLDIRIPGSSGFDICREVLKYPEAPAVLMLTSYSEPALLNEAIQAGAQGFVLKNADGEALADAIRKVAAGESVLDRALSVRLFETLRQRPGPSDTRNSIRVAQLSAQERRVLGGVVDGKTNKEIAMELDLSPKTVKNYLSNAMDKLGVGRRAQAAAIYVKHQGELQGALPSAAG
jgi:DNA-binding NarL/FixJ family response regulator